MNIRERYQYHVRKLPPGKVTLQSLYQAVLTNIEFTAELFEEMETLMSNQASLDVDVKAIDDVVVAMDAHVSEGNAALQSILGEIATLKGQGVNTAALDAEVAKLQTSLSGLGKLSSDMGAVVPAPAPTPAPAPAPVVPDPNPAPAPAPTQDFHHTDGSGDTHTHA